MRESLWRCMGAGLMAVVLAGCKASGSQSSDAQRSEALGGTGGNDDASAYAPGVWRNARAQYNDYYVAIAHILITHDKSDIGSYSGYWPWLEAWPAANRTRGEARDLAANLARALRADPGHFEASANEFSDDQMTRAYGGTFGVMRAPNVPAELLDVYETLSDHQVSESFETPAGYHIIERLPIPVESFVWARRIMVMYTPSLALPMVRHDRQVSRSRGMARQLADELHRRLLVDPTAFAALVDTYSDDLFAPVGGEMGPQSNLSGTLNIASRITLERLKPMEISDVVDDFGGYAIIQRLPNGPLERRAFEAFTVAFEGAAPGNEIHRTEAEAQELASEVAKNLATHPTQFEAAKAQFCAELPCASKSTTVTDGSTQPLIYRQLGKLAIGEVSTVIEPGESGIRVYKRVAVPEQTVPRIYHLKASSP